MTTFTRTWNSAYEAQPADTENIDLGAGRIRNLKEDINERLAVNHSWDGDTEDGEHTRVTFKAPLGSDPSNVANKGVLYTKDVSSKVELFFIDEDGNVIQLTTAGAINVATPNTAITGEVRMWTTASPPTNWLICDGSAISRTTYAALFAVIGTTFGVGDGSTTFNIPDFRGRVPVGSGTGDATGATAHALGAKPTSGKGGEEKHVQLEAEMFAHKHDLLAKNGAANTKAVDTGYALAEPDTSDVYHTTSVPDTVLDAASISEEGGADGMNIMQPYSAINFIIKT